MLQAAWNSKDTERAVRMSHVVRARATALLDSEQLAYTVAHAAEAGMPAIATLAEALPPTDSSIGQEMAKKLNGKLSGGLTCKVATKLGTFATRAKAALPQLKFAAEPVSKALQIAEKVDNITNLVAEVFASPNATKSFVVDQITELVQLFADHPLKPVGKAVNVLHALGQRGVDMIMPLVDKIMAFLASLPAKFERITLFVRGQLSRLSDGDKVSKALAKIRSTLSGKAFCDIMAKVSRFVKLAISVIESFLPDTGKLGKLKSKMLDVLDSVQSIATPSELLDKYVEPALLALTNISTASDTLGNASTPLWDAMLRFAQPAIEGAMRDLTTEGVDRLVSTVSELASEAIDELTEKAGELSAELIEKIMPAWLPPLLAQVAKTVRDAYQTIRFVHQLMDQQGPILRLLELPGNVAQIACGSAECSPDDAPARPELSLVSPATNGVYDSGEGATRLRKILAPLTDPASAEQCSNERECRERVARGMDGTKAKLATFSQELQSVAAVGPFVGWYAGCAQESAHRSKRTALPLELIAGAWRSLTQPGGLTERLKRGVCRDGAVRARHGEPMYDVPDWLAPSFCDGADWMVRACLERCRALCSCKQLAPRFSSHCFSALPWTFACSSQLAPPLRPTSTHTVTRFALPPHALLRSTQASPLIAGSRPKLSKSGRRSLRRATGLRIGCKTCRRGPRERWISSMENSTRSRGK
jgi:hypothetical protein